MGAARAGSPGLGGRPGHTARPGDRQHDPRGGRGGRPQGAAPAAGRAGAGVSRRRHPGRPRRTDDPGPRRGGLPPAARRAPVRQRLLHLPQARRVPRPLPYPRTGHTRRLRGPSSRGGGDRTGTGRRSAAHGAVPQRPAAGELHPLRHRGQDRRLPALGEQRPGLRAGRHRRRGRLRPGPDHPAGPRLLRHRRPAAHLQGPAQPDHVQPDLDALVRRAPRAAQGAGDRRRLRLRGRGGRQVLTSRTGPGRPGVRAARR